MRRLPFDPRALRALSAALALCATAPAPRAQQTERADAASALSSLGGAAAAISGTTIVSRDVITAAGDTFRSIARRELGTAGYAPQLAEFNDLLASARLEPGQIVRIPIVVAARGEVATVVFVKGEVTRNGEPLGRDDFIAQGDLIVTGDDGFASIEFSSGSIFNLQPASRATITRLNCLEADDSCLIEIEADAGDLSSEIERRPDQPVEYRISTPFAAAAVRGTVFDFIVEEAALRTAVTEGEVVVAAQGIEGRLPEGYGSVTREGEPPGEVRPLLPAPVFRTVPTRVAAGDAIRWFALREVERYEATLARDPDGIEAVAEIGTSTESLALPADLETGDYYLALRGVDRFDLPGYRATARLSVARIDPDVAPVETRVTREGGDFLIEIVDPPEDAPGFEVQVATTPDFDDPLSVDVSDRGRAVLRLEGDTLYARSRVLIDPETVSAYGPVASTAD